MRVGKDACLEQINQPESKDGMKALRGTLSKEEHGCTLSVKFEDKEKDPRWSQHFYPSKSSKKSLKNFREKFFACQHAKCVREDHKGKG